MYSWFILYCYWSSKILKKRFRLKTDRIVVKFPLSCQKPLAAISKQHDWNLGPKHIPDNCCILRNILSKIVPFLEIT